MSDADKEKQDARAQGRRIVQKAAEDAVVAKFCEMAYTLFDTSQAAVALLEEDIRRIHGLTSDASTAAKFERNFELVLVKLAAPEPKHSDGRLTLSEPLARVAYLAKELGLLRHFTATNSAGVRYVMQVGMLDVFVWEEWITGKRDNPGYVLLRSDSDLRGNEQPAKARYMASEHDIIETKEHIEAVFEATSEWLKVNKGK
jgi:hypothetical protein